MKYLYILIIFLYTLQPSIAQDQSILTGKVTDHNGLPLAGVNIRLEENKLTVLSDERGYFQLKVPVGDYKVTASCVGFTDKILRLTLSTGKANPVNIRLDVKEEQMEEVVVSGVKIQTTTVSPTRVQIQDVPQAITVITQRMIRQQAAFDLSTLTRNVPGLTFTGNYSGAGSAQFFNARGFDLNETQNYRWNGVMTLNWGNHYADNIEQVEFLKGPASILFGDVAPGGIMNFVTKKPLADFSANVNFKTGSWALLRPSIDITGPIVKDRTLRYRLNSSFERQKSFRDHVKSSSVFAAPAISWDISKKVNVNIEAVFKDAKATDDAGLISPDGTAGGLRSLRPSLYLGEPSRQYLFKTQNYFMRSTYEPNALWRFKMTGFYGVATNRPFGIWFDPPDALGDFIRREYGFYRRALNKSLSAEASGVFFTGKIKHSLSIGLDYQVSRSRHTNGGELDSLDTRNLFSTTSEHFDTEEPAESPWLPYAMIINRKGIHIHDQLSLMNNRLHIYGGVRASHTAQGNRYIQNEVSGTVYEGLQDDVVDKLMFIPRFGLIYKPNPNYSIYTSYSRGFEINSPDIFARNYLEYASPPSTISNQVELGLKTSIFKNQLGLALAVFSINKKRPYGYVYLNPENPNYDEYNVYYDGHHRSRGIELEADGRLGSALTFNAGLAINSTRVIDDPGYPTGNRLPNAPRFSFNYWMQYENIGRLKGFTAGTGIFYKGNFYSGIDNEPALLMPAAYTWDVAAGYQMKKLGLQANLMNLTNQVSYLNPWQFNLFDVRPLRQLVVTLNYKFTR